MGPLSTLSSLIGGRSLIALTLLRLMMRTWDSGGLLLRLSRSLMPTSQEALTAQSSRVSLFFLLSFFFFFLEDLTCLSLFFPSLQPSTSTLSPLVWPISLRRTVCRILTLTTTERCSSTSMLTGSRGSELSSRRPCWPPSLPVLCRLRRTSRSSKIQLKNQK